MLVLTGQLKHPVEPKHIDASRHLWSAFGNQETEVSAGWLVRFAQDRGEGWAPFTYEEIDKYYQERCKNPGGPFTFNRLLDVFIVRGPTEEHPYCYYPKPSTVLFFTAEFVGRCVASSPLLEELAAPSTD